jgi:hypothetical protein
MELYPLPVHIRTYRMNGVNLDLVYPMVEGMSDLAVQHRINQTILSVVHQLLIQQNYTNNPYQTSVTGRYEIKTNERGILSLSIINYAFAGGAHGLTIVKSITVDTTTGQVYDLADLFKPGSNYVQVLSEIVGRQIKERDVTVLGEYKGISSSQDFYLADKALVLYFQLYDLVPYAYGFPYFPISVYEIQNILNEDKPLGKMLF